MTSHTNASIEQKTIQLDSTRHRCRHQLDINMELSQVRNTQVFLPVINLITSGQVTLTGRHVTGVSRGWRHVVWTSRLNSKHSSRYLTEPIFFHLWKRSENVPHDRYNVSNLYLLYILNYTSIWWQLTLFNVDVKRNSFKSYILYVHEEMKLRRWRSLFYQKGLFFILSSTSKV